MDDKLRRSRKQEKDGAKRFGGQVNSRSGAGDIRKNDVRTDTESIEFKTTTKKSYSLKYADLYLAFQHAITDGRTMIFGIEFTGLQGNRSRRYVVMLESDYLGMRDELEEFRATEHCLRELPPQEDLGTYP